MLIGEGHEATPDRASVQEKLTVTGELFQPAKLGAGLWLALMVGGVLSILIGMLELAELPARSNAVPEAIWFSPSVLNKNDAGQTAIPEVASLHRKLISTFVLFQPKAFGEGMANSASEGGSLSIPMTVTVSDVPGLLRSSTETALFDANMTARSSALTLGSKSLGTNTCVPLIETTALATP